MYSLGSRRCFSTFALLPALLALATPARADKVLVYQVQTMEVAGADEAGPAVAELLEGLDHDVTREISATATLPSDLSGFDTVWVVQVAETTGVQQTTLVDYVNAGGGLYLTGENHPCCAALNRSIQPIMNRLVPEITMMTSAGEIGDEWTAATDTWGITTTPNALPTLLTGDPGAMAQIAPRNQVYKDSAGDKIGMAAWTGEYLTEGGGCVAVNMDLSFWTEAVHPEIDKTPFAENVQRFLATCADSDRDGLSDVGEEEAGTDAESPDSDGDGLCDGYRAVVGVCIAGESVFVNTDEDELVNPLDPDDDNDGVPTSFEVEAELAKPNADDYGDPAWVDLDSDNNNIPDRVEGFTDHDGDGIPSIVDLGDDPENCDEDSDCDVQPGSLGCNDETGFCEFPAQVPPQGEGGAPSEPTAGGSPSEPDGGTPSTSGGAPGKGSPSDGGSTEAEGGGSSDESSADSANDSGGCGCSVPGRPTSALAALWLLALWVARRKRSARTSTT
jgi:MYXO-CTERM domain-containing protein